MGAEVYRGKRWQRITLAVLDRDKWICQLCFLPIARHARPLADGKGSADHVIPVSAGGAWWDLANLRAAHLGCNRNRGAGSTTGQQYPMTEPW